MTDSDQFGRSVKIVANDGKEEIEIITSPGLFGIQCKFEVQKSADTTPNELDLEIYNLAGKSREFFNKKNTVVTLYAGYAGKYAQIFKGNIELPGNEHQNTEWVTKVFCKDGGAALRTLTISKTFKKGTSETEIINYILKRLTLPPAIQTELKALNQLAKGKIQTIGFKPATKTVVKKTRQTQEQKAAVSIEQQRKNYVQRQNIKQEQAKERKNDKATILHGLAKDSLEKLINKAGLNCNIEGQTINIWPKGLALDQNVIYLDPTTGLIGSPERIEKGYKVISQLNSEIVPGKLITVDSAYLLALVLVRHLVHRGDTTGDSDFTTESYCTDYQE